MGRGRAWLRAAGSVAVPDLRGLTVTEALAVATDSGLLLVDPDGRPPSASQGPVTEQRPAAGSRVPPRSQVTVWTAGPGDDAGVRVPLRPHPPRSRRHAEAEQSAPEPTG